MNGAISIARDTSALKAISVDFHTGSEAAIWFLGGACLGVISSMHCLGMCGPIALYFGNRFGSGAPDKKAVSWVRFSVVVLGKACSYSVLGLLFGAAGAFLSYTPFLQKIPMAMPLLMSLIFLFAGGSLLGWWPSIEIAFKPIEKKLLSVIGGAPRSKDISFLFLCGILWGFIPCPMVLVPALASAVSGGAAGFYGALRGFFMMLGFGIGTVPVLALSAFFGNFLSGAVRKKSMVLAGGIFLVLSVANLYFLMTHHFGWFGSEKEHSCCQRAESV